MMPAGAAPTQVAYNPMRYDAPRGMGVELAIDLPEAATGVAGQTPFPPLA